MAEWKNASSRDLIKLQFSTLSGYSKRNSKRKVLTDHLGKNRYVWFHFYVKVLAEELMVAEFYSLKITIRLLHNNNSIFQESIHYEIRM